MLGRSSEMGDLLKDLRNGVVWISVARYTDMLSIGMNE